MSLPQFLIKVEVYINGNNPHVEFKLPEGATSLANLTYKLNELLSDIDNIRVRKIEFREDCIDSNGRVKCNLIELKTDEDVKTMWKSFRRRITKGSIELDAHIIRFVDDIIKMLKHPEPSIW
ncbi:uncharacterized protein LOC131628809 [Vicia villosa]|uniref:uncharacterized protein LOC131628809 n=1 Tax=Vicia villosa TaxID=3911 RepID=UPI00273A9A02|nr:uncharacterized protein LOC131628809 [Vicia villosa]